MEVRSSGFRLVSGMGCSAGGCGYRLQERSLVNMKRNAT